MIWDNAKTIYSNLHGYTRTIDNDFHDNDQYYVRLFFKDRQFLIKGINRFKIIEVGLNGGIDYKTIKDNLPLSEVKAAIKSIK